ncbi:zf-CCHC_4 domain-containing protein [Raphanus sativus]|nr:zf-CCHC_4 domain-containing protein [Raphanus sativus]
MKLDLSLPSGEIKEVELQYEKLEKHCFSCFSLSHEVEECPYQRARSNYGARPHQLGISQRQTLERIDAGKRRLDSRRQNRYSPEPEQQLREQASSYNRGSDRAIDWVHDKDFYVHYGARRDPHHNESRRQQESSGHANARPSARDRLSLPKDSSASLKTGNSRLGGSSQRSEWRRVQGGSASVQSHVSHTPSPRPNREQMQGSGNGLRGPVMQSGERSFPSNERRSALERLSASKDRVPLLLDGEANANSGRLQGISVLQGDDLRHRHSSGGSSRHPSSKAAGKAHVDQSPIRTLSEDRRHVSLRLGPMLDSEETILEDIPLPRRIGEASLAGRKAQGKKKMNIPSSTRKRAGRSPPQGVSTQSSICCCRGELGSRNLQSCKTKG